MIKVNLLPPEVGKRTTAKAKAAGPSLLPYFLVLAILYAAAASAGFMAYQKGAQARDLAAKKTKERDKKKEEVKKREKEFEENNLLSQEIEEKFAVVQALGPDSRIFWSEKINMIAQARLNLAVYVTKITLTEKIDEIETPESRKRREQWKAAQAKTPNAKTKEPTPIKEPVINQTLTIHAIAYGTDSSQRLRQVTAFYDNLRNLKWERESGKMATFLYKLAPEFGQLPQKVAQVGGVDVLRFGFGIQADPQKSSVAAGKPAAAAGSAASLGTAAAAPAKKAGDAKP